jgi:hypothetical protein
LKALTDDLKLGGLITHFRFGNNSFEHAERSMRMFAEEILPVMHTWDTGPFAQIRLPEAATA